MTAIYGHFSVFDFNVVSHIKIKTNELNITFSWESSCFLTNYSMQRRGIVEC